jgi:cyclopropane fatty-acyl-phospholipid synthase-like methyltransferase
MHAPLAEKIARTLDMTDVRQLMDLGGSSGVISLAMLNRYANLTAVVVDIENVCNIGRQIADETSVANRITYQVAGFLQDKLPSGFDMIMQCDAGIYTKEFFSKHRDLLKEGGSLVIVSNIDDFSAWLDHPKSVLSFHRNMNKFLSSLAVSKFSKRVSTVTTVKQLLTQAGFQTVSDHIWENGTVIIQAFN